MFRIAVDGLVVFALGLTVVGIWRILNKKLRQLAKAGVLAILMSALVLYASMANNFTTLEEKEELRALQSQEQSELRSLAGLLVPQEDQQLGDETLSNLLGALSGSQTIPHWAHGVYEDGQRVSFDSDWVFPYGTGHLGSVEVMSGGAILPDGFAAEPIAAFAAHLSLVPGVSDFHYGRTPSNSYEFVWTEARDGRIGGAPFSGRIELFRNGDVAIDANGTAAILPRTLPFAHDGFGQDAAWIEANFARLQALSPSLTNAAEILSVGYTNWVDDQVGIDLTNGLYKFTATFSAAPPEATLLTVGDYSVAVTNAGEYTVILGKGTEYEFETNPYDDTVEYRIQDDLLDEEEPMMLMSWWGGSESPGEWTTDGGWKWLYYPMFGYPGQCSWMPTLRGSPDVPHIGPDDQDIVFEAVLSDYVGSAEPTFTWTSSSEDVHFTNPTAQSTDLTFDSFPSWNTLGLTVRADLGGYSLWSSLYPTYGTNDHPTVSFSLSAPEVVFLNDDDRTTRWYRVAMKLSCPVETNATISIAHSGETGAKFSPELSGGNCFSLTNVQLVVSSGGSDAVYQFYCACTNLGSGSFSAICTVPSGEILSDGKTYRVIEPLRKLVCTNDVSGGYYNPSRLVYGTNAWLKVFASGAYGASEVQWGVVSGPGRMTATNNWSVSVEPTASEGEVVVEAAFGKDSLVQPRFVLPIVTRRTLPVRAFVVSTNNVTAASIEGRIDYANKIFSQIGVYLELVSVSNNVGLDSDYVVSEFDMTTNTLGQVRKTVSQQAIRIMNTYASGDCLELYFVNRIVNGRAVAFRTDG